MIIEYIRYELSEHAPDSFSAAYSNAFQHLDAAPECLGYEFSQCADDPLTFILRIQWTSAEAHLNGFRKGIHFPAFLKEIRAYIPEVVEMRHYNVLIKGE